MCVDPKIAFESLMEQEPRSVILTSGALSPLEEFAKEIGL
jgi:Rad3-related DNA helicase